MFRKDEFGKRLMEERTRAGMTREELEKKAGVSRQAIWRYENGQYVPSAETLYLICEAVGRSADYMIGRAEA